jgi:ATP-dependent DNA ligase
VQYRRTTKILLDLEKPSSGEWLHEIEYDGFRKSYSRPGMIQTESLSVAKPICYRNFPT